MTTFFKQMLASATDNANYGRGNSTAVPVLIFCLVDVIVIFSMRPFCNIGDDRFWRHLMDVNVSLVLLPAVLLRV
jgi:hypothetical protein